MWLKNCIVEYYIFIDGARIDVKVGRNFIYFFLN